MTCNKHTGSSDDRFLNQQEHRNINRSWERAFKKHSRVNLQQNSPHDEFNDFNDSAQRGVHFGQEGFYDCVPCEPDGRKFPSEFIQKKLAKGKSFSKKKSPLQKFDEVVTRELTVSEKKLVLPTPILRIQFLYIYKYAILIKSEIR